MGISNKVNILWLGKKNLYAAMRMRDTAKKQKIKINCLEIPECAFIVKNKHAACFVSDKNLVKHHDAIIIRTIYPYTSEILTIAKLFKKANRVVIDGSLADNECAISKMHDYLILTQNNLPVPETYQVFNREKIESIARSIGYPCVLKGIHGSHGKHVYLIKNKTQLLRHLRQYPPGELLLQKFIPAPYDFRVLTVGYKALPYLLVKTPQAGDFRTNFALGARFSSRPIANFTNLTRLAEKAAKTLRREFAAIDIRLSNKKPHVLEVNRHPDFEGFEKATNLDVASEFLKYITTKIYKGALK